MLLKTKDLTMIRGQTLVETIYVTDDNGGLVSLTGATAYLWVRADMKVDATIKLASAVTAAHRVGIVIPDQTGAQIGQVIVTFVPADTLALIAAGRDDPYFYDAWIVDAAANHTPIRGLSKLALFAQATTTP